MAYEGFEALLSGLLLMSLSCFITRWFGTDMLGVEIKETKTLVYHFGFASSYGFKPRSVPNSEHESLTYCRH